MKFPRAKQIMFKIKKTILSHNHGKNGLVDLSYQEPIGTIQDYGQLSTMSQENLKAIFEISENEAKLFGTIENLKKSKEEFELIFENLVKRLKQW